MKKAYAKYNLIFIITIIVVYLFSKFIHKCPAKELQLLD